MKIQHYEVPCGELHAIRTPTRLPDFAGVGGTSRCQKGRDGRTPFERLHGKKPTQERATRIKGAGETDTRRTD